MSEALLTSRPTTFAATRNATSSPESGSGATPCDPPDGQTTDLFGQPLCPASPSPQPEAGRALPTSAISQKCGFGSPQSAALQSALASRLSLQLASGGSTLFSYALSNPTTPAGRQYFRLAASGRRTDGPGFIGWQSPNMSDIRGACKHHPQRADGGQPNMAWEAQLTGWPTPQAKEQLEDSESKVARGMHAGLNLAVAASWATPRAEDSESAGMRHSRRDGKERNDTTPRQAFGVMPSGSPAATAKRGQLNPGLSRWLMGLPIAWDLFAPAKEQMDTCRRSSKARKAASGVCEATAMPLSDLPQPNSSGPA